MNISQLQKRQGIETGTPHHSPRIEESCVAISHEDLPSTGHRLESVQGLSKDGNTKFLYDASRAREGHFEATDVLPAILKMHEHLESIYGGRISPERMIERFSQMQERASAILNTESFVEGVFFFGSSIRGRVDSNDIDMFLVLRQGTVTGMLDRFGSWLQEKVGLPEEHTMAVTFFPSLLLIAPLIFESRRALRISNRVVNSPLGAPIDGLEVDLQVRTGLYPDGLNPIDAIAFPFMLSEVLTESGPYVCFMRGISPKSLGAYFTEGNPGFYSKERSKQKSPFGPSSPIRF